MKELYMQEISELTELLREDEDWEDLRSILRLKGFDYNHILLVSFIEDEEENEYGVVVTCDLNVFEYSRSTKDGIDIFNSIKINDITNTDKLDKYPQVSIAIDMINSGEIF